MLDSDFSQVRLNNSKEFEKQLNDNKFSFLQFRYKLHEHLC